LSHATEHSNSIKTYMKLHALIRVQATLGEEARSMLRPRCAACKPSSWRRPTLLMLMTRKKTTVLPTCRCYQPLVVATRTPSHHARGPRQRSDWLSPLKQQSSKRQNAASEVSATIRLAPKAFSRAAQRGVRSPAAGSVLDGVAGA
jgi:hypothetical protein